MGVPEVCSTDETERMKESSLKVILFVLGRSLSRHFLKRECLNLCKRRNIHTEGFHIKASLEFRQKKSSPSDFQPSRKTGYSLKAVIILENKAITKMNC